MARAQGGEASSILLPLLLAQVVVGARVLARLARTANGTRIAAVEGAPRHEGAVSAIVPVLNEHGRLAPCLDGLLAQGPELHEILVVDGGSLDGTQALAASYRVRDRRIRVIDASPVPTGWNGKAWGLEIGARHATGGTSWLLTIDADVRPRPALTSSLLAHAARTQVGALSVATEQELSGVGMALVHPALLATLVYRFGIPGHATRQVAAVQANGQCMLIRRDLLKGIGGFAVARSSLCEDVTLARQLAESGCEVGFYESDRLVSTRMYESGWETFVNWPRSLPLRDHLAGRSWLIGLLEVTFVQAAPLVIVLLMVLRNIQSRPIDSPSLAGGRRGRRAMRTSAHSGQGRATPPFGGARWTPDLRSHGDARRREHRLRRFMLAVNLVLLAMRLGILVGTARAYHRRPLTYWLSPLLDLPAVVQLWRSALAGEHRWRGRILVRREAA